MKRAVLLAITCSWALVEGAQANPHAHRPMLIHPVQTPVTRSHTVKRFIQRNTVTHPAVLVGLSGTSAGRTGSTSLHLTSVGGSAFGSSRHIMGISGTGLGRRH